MAVIRRRGQKPTHIPREIWLEIRSRLPIKDLFKYRSVCKCFERIPINLRDKIQKLPLCGLIFRDKSFAFAIDGNSHITYLSMSTKHITTIKTYTSTDEQMTISSGFDSGFLRDLSFDFGSLSSLSQGEFFTIHKGLILVGKNGGTLHVHNPATKQVFNLPTSPLVEDGLISSPWDKFGFIINLCSNQVCRSFQFLVVRLYPGMVETFYSYGGIWRFSILIIVNVNDELLITTSWCHENYVFIHETKTLFFLTSMDQGLAVGFDNVANAPRNDSEISLYSFPLPDVVKGGFRYARLGESRECLYLSYIDENDGLLFWKRGGHRPVADNDDTWVLLLEIGKTAKLSRSLESDHNHLFKLVKASDVIIPIGFYPNFAIAFLYAKPCIYAYDLTNKTLEKIAEINDQEDTLSTVVLPYVPFIVPLETSTRNGRLNDRVKFYSRLT